MTTNNPRNSTPPPGLTRRELLQSAPATGLALGTGAFAGTLAATTAPARAQTGQPPLQGPGIEMSSGQAIYSLPRDHAWHGSEFYQTNDFNEWHYITVLGRDLDTGERISVFWVPLSQGWVAKEGRPLHNVLFAFHNLDTGEFHTALLYITGPMTTEGSARTRRTSTSATRSTTARAASRPPTRTPTRRGSSAATPPRRTTGTNRSASR